MLFTPMCFHLLLILLAAVTVPATADKHETGFLDRTLTFHNTTYKYQVFVPDNWSPEQEWPIILFLHGAGERGSDGLLQTQVGIATAIRNGRSRFPAVVVMPQCPAGHWWSEPPMQQLALEALAAATKEFKGDSRRTHITGLSMGGYGSWYLASSYPGKFAAIVPICGGIVPPANVLQAQPELAQNSYPDEPKSYTEVATKIGKTPVWIFHGGVDETVPVENSRKLNDALKTAGGNVRYSEYPGVAHESWDKAYAEPDLIPWLLSQCLK